MTARRSLLRGNQFGYSLVEMVMTLAIGLILVSVALPILVGAIQSYRLNSIAQQTADLIELTRYTAIGAIVGALGGLVAIVILGATGQLSLWLLPGTAAWCLLVILGFHDNIGRLVKGTESKLGT